MAACALLPAESSLAAGNQLASPSTVYAYLSALMLLDRHEIAALALTLGILAFAVIPAILLVRSRRRLAELSAAKHDEGLAARGAIDRAHALLLSDPQILITWAAGSEQAELLGDPSVVSGKYSVLAFEDWLPQALARELERCVDALRARGVSFAMTLTTRANQLIEAEGQVVGGCAILRLREISGIKYQLAELMQRHQKQTADTAALQALVEAVPGPVWHRDEAGKLAFVNEAYARAVEMKDAAEAIERGIELFDHAARTELLHAHETGKPYRGRLPAVVAGERRSLDVITAPAPHGSAGIAIDASEAELMRAELRRMQDAQRRTLDQLPLTALSGTWLPISWTMGPPTQACSIGFGRLASCPTSRISGIGKACCTRPIGRWKPKSTCGICLTAERSALSPRPTRRGASSTCSTT
jgi:PAS domain-containing protein